MPSILKEIAPGTPSAEVTLSNGQKVTVKALSNRQWARLFERFPGLANVRPQANGEDRSEADLIVTMRSTSAVIAAGLGNEADPEEEEAADKLPLIDQRALVNTINELSFPEELRAGPLASENSISGGSQTPGSS